MSKYTEVSGAGANANIVATGGINALGLIGAYERVMFAESAHKFASIPAAKIQDNWDADAISGELTYLGKCKFEDNSEEAQFFTDPPLNINIETTSATKVIRSILQVNSCVHAELKKMSGKSGRVFFQTTNGFMVGRYEDDGDIVGRECSIAVSQRSVPTTDTPVEYTIIDITMTDNDGDELNPFEAKLDWLFSEVEQVYPITGVVDNVSSGAGTLNLDLTLTKAGSNAPLSGAVLADFSATDEDGNALSIATVTETGTTGVYAIAVTTTATTVYIRFNGRRTIAGATYYFDTVIAKAA